MGLVYSVIQCAAASRLHTFMIWNRIVSNRISYAAYWIARPFNWTCKMDKIKFKMLQCSLRRLFIISILINALNWYHGRALHIRTMGIRLNASIAMEEGEQAAYVYFNRILNKQRYAISLLFSVTLGKLILSHSQYHSIRFYLHVLSHSHFCFCRLLTQSRSKLISFNISSILSAIPNDLILLAVEFIKTCNKIKWNELSEVHRTSVSKLCKLLCLHNLYQFWNQHLDWMCQVKRK